MTTDNEFDFDAIIDKAKASFNRHLSVIKGQQMTELDDPEWHIANEAWQAATAEANKRIEALEGEVANVTSELNAMNENYQGLLHKSNQQKTYIKVLREALEKLAGTNGYVKSVALQALAKTPAQSLAQHDDEVIERCAIRGRLAQLENKVVDIEICKLKGKHEEYRQLI